MAVWQTTSLIDKDSPHNCHQMFVDLQTCLRQNPYSRRRAHPRTGPREMQKMDSPSAEEEEEEDLLKHFLAIPQDHLALPDLPADLLHLLALLVLPADHPMDMQARLL